MADPTTSFRRARWTAFDRSRSSVCFRGSRAAAPLWLVGVIATHREVLGSICQGPREREVGGKSTVAIS